MLVNQAVRLAMLTAVVLTDSHAAARSLKLCGRTLSEAVSVVCRRFNVAAWDGPTVVEQPAGAVRRKRHTGIADECCSVDGCSFEILISYCPISTHPEPPVESMEHLIADRSAEAEAAAAAPAVVGSSGRAGAGSGRRRARGCWCRRRRRAGRRRAELMGNTDIIKNVVRAAPLVGTVSPLLTWGRTLNTDLPSLDRDRYAYVAVYT